MFFDDKIIKNNLNVEIGDVVVKDVGEKIGSIFGKAGAEIGKTVDDCTKWLTIKIS